MQYKIGNKANGIIRSYCAGKVGNFTAEYGNQPLCRFKDTQVSIHFRSMTKESQGHMGVKELSYNRNQVDSISISGIPLTTRILDLIFEQNQFGLCSLDKDYMSDENSKIYLDLPKDTIYQVFIFDDEGKLEAAYGEYSDIELTVNKPNSPYLIFYSYESNKSYIFNKPANSYVKLDLEFVGNGDDDTIPMFMHFDKCSISSNDYLSLNNSANTIDLTFTVINTQEDYISIQ